MKRYTALAAAGLGFAVMASPVHADYLTFFGEDVNDSESVPLGSTPNASQAENDFLSNLIGTGTEDFEGFSSGTDAPLSMTFPGAGTATLTGDGDIQSVSAGNTEGNGRYGTSPTNFWETDAGDFVIELEGETAAFGFFGIDIGDFGQQVQISLNDDNGTVFEPGHSLGVTGSTGGSVLFFGLIGTTAADTFTQITFNALDDEEQSNDVFAFDDMTIGSLEQVNPDPTTVSAPGMLALFTGGLMALGAAFRRRSPQA